MQQLVSSLIQYNIFQISVLVAHAVLFIVVAIIAISLEKTPAFISAIFAFMICAGAIVLSIVFSSEAHQEVENHKYVAVKNGKALEIESKSDLIKSRKFEIDSEDADHIYVKVNSLLWSNTFIINKSDIDEVKN